MKRIIPCLDLKDGRVVKGVNFVNLTDAGDPIQVAKAYQQMDADEIVLLDITATVDGRATMLEVMKKVASVVNIPITVGGGVSTIEQFQALIDIGISKVGINSSAVKNPEFIKQIAQKFGSNKLVVAVDVKANNNGGWNVVINGGNTDTGLDAVQWMKEVEKLGAGEILLTSMDCDGVKNGYDIPLTKLACESVNIPIIASGGAGTMEHFAQVLSPEVGASGALGASVFHFKKIDIQQLKQYLRSQNIDVKI